MAQLELRELPQEVPAGHKGDPVQRCPGRWDYLRRLLAALAGLRTDM